MNLQRVIRLSRKRQAAHKAEMAKIRRLQEQTDDEIAEAQRLANSCGPPSAPSGEAANSANSS